MLHAHTNRMPSHSYPASLLPSSPDQFFWKHAPYTHPLTFPHHIPEATDSYAHPEASNPRRSVMAQAGLVLDPSGNRGATSGSAIHQHASVIGRIPGASMKDRLHSYRAVLEMVQRNPRLAEERRFIVRLRGEPQPLGVVVLHVGKQSQRFYCPCAAASRTEHGLDLAHVRDAIVKSDILRSDDAQLYRRRHRVQYSPLHVVAMSTN